MSVSLRVSDKLGSSSWLEVGGQNAIDGFAACTRAPRWIHVDGEQAAAGPFGATVAHGFQATVERERETKPVCVADPVLLVTPADSGIV